MSDLDDMDLPKSPIKISFETETIILDASLTSDVCIDGPAKKRECVRFVVIGW